MGGVINVPAAFFSLPVSNHYKVAAYNPVVIIEEPLPSTVVLGEQENKSKEQGCQP